MSSVLHATSLITLVFMGASVADLETPRRGATDAASDLRSAEPRHGDGGPTWSPGGAVPLMLTDAGLEGGFALGPAGHGGSAPNRVVPSRMRPDAEAFVRRGVDVDRDGRLSQDEQFETQHATGDELSPERENLRDRMRVMLDDAGRRLAGPPAADPSPLASPTSRTIKGASEYALVRVLEVAGRQGIATDGERYFVSGSTALHVYSKDGERLKSNDDPFADLEKRANHLGDISVHDGEIYAGIEWFEDGRGADIQIAVYDAETLEFRRAFPWNPESGQTEVSALAVDPANGLVWMTDWVDGTYVYRYRLDDGSYAGKLHLRPVPQWQQGIACYRGSLYITADDGDADHQEADNLWRVQADPGATAAYVSHELAFDQLRDLGEIEGIDFDEAASEMIVLSNRGKRIVKGMPMGLYPGYTREISEVYVFKVVK